MLNLNGLVFYVINIQDLPLAKYIGRTDSINGGSNSMGLPFPMSMSDDIVNIVISFII